MKLQQPLEEVVLATRFGKELRQLRLEHEELLYDMARKLGITSSYLSAIELGKRNVPSNFVEQIVHMYDVNPDRKRQLLAAINADEQKIVLNLTSKNEAQIQLALKFAEKFDELDETTMGKIMRMLSD